MAASAALIEEGTASVGAAAAGGAGREPVGVGSAQGVMGGEPGREGGEPGSEGGEEGGNMVDSIKVVSSMIFVRVRTAFVSPLCAAMIMSFSACVRHSVIDCSSGKALPG